MQMDEDSRVHEELREQYNLQERRLCLMQTETEEVRSGLEASERSRKLLEQELVDVSERHNELSVQVWNTHKIWFICCKRYYGQTNTKNK